MWKDEARRLIRDLCRLCSAWWRVDRVRVSVREGQMLRIKPPCLLLISGRLVQVRDRRVDSSGSGVVYRCETHAGSGTLWVRPAPSTLHPLLHWQEGVSLQELSGEQIEVLG